METLVAAREVSDLERERGDRKATFASWRFGVVALGVCGSGVEGSGCKSAESSNADDGSEETHGDFALRIYVIS